VSESEQRLDTIIEAYRDVLRAYVQGNPDPVLTLWSEAEDATLANSFGPHCRGRAAIESASRQAVARRTSVAHHLTEDTPITCPRRRRTTVDIGRR
jgi:hypothetical protein